MKSFTSVSLTVFFLAKKKTITTEMLAVLDEVCLELQLIWVYLPRSEKTRTRRSWRTRKTLGGSCCVPDV